MSAGQQVHVMGAAEQVVADKLSRAPLTAKERAAVRWRSPVIVWNNATPEERADREIAWKRGLLEYKLTPSQRTAYKVIKRWAKATDQGRVFALDSSRRWGKSVLLLLLAIEFAIRNPGSRIVYCAPTYKMVARILLPLMAEMLSDCPPEQRPKWHKSEQYFGFGNSSRLELVGLDLNPDGARGTGVDQVFLDEAGFFDTLTYLLNSIIKPQMLGRLHARIICASTPSKTPGHYWSSELVPMCIGLGAHDLKTLLDANQYADEEKQEFIDDCPGGRNGTTCRREYFCEHIVDEASAILPEFRDVEADIVVEWPIPDWRDCYTILDPGFNDLAACLFVWWDFDNQILVVEDEFAKSRENSRGVAEAIKKIEKERWSGSLRKGPGYTLRQQPFMRFSDNDPSLIYDMACEHDLVFASVQKKSLELMVNAVRVALQSKKIRIHPRCKKLIAHCRNGIWKNTRSAKLSFDRPGGEFGHYDLIACLVYAELSVHKHRLPIPAVEKVVRGDIKTGYREGEAKRSKWQREPRAKPEQARAPRRAHQKAH